MSGSGIPEPGDPPPAEAMSWYDEFVSKIAEGRKCPCCSESWIIKVDWTGYTWRCEHFVFGRTLGYSVHSGLDLIKQVRRASRNMFKPFKPMRSNPEHTEDEVKEKVGSTNEFGEVTP